MLRLAELAAEQFTASQPVDSQIEGGLGDPYSDGRDAHAPRRQGRQRRVRTLPGFTEGIVGWDMYLVEHDVGGDLGAVDRL